MRVRISLKLGWAGGGVVGGGVPPLVVGMLVGGGVKDAGFVGTPDVPGMPDAGFWIPEVVVNVDEAVVVVPVEMLVLLEAADEPMLPAAELLDPEAWPNALDV